MSATPEPIERAEARYEAAAHAMQSGVAMKMSFAPSETTPKHLRVGVNSALSNAGGLVTLLMEKGLITREEYTSAIADAMERERDIYLSELREHFGHDGINLA